MSNLPKTGAPCGCRPGLMRDNCPQCEGSGMRIDWRAFHDAKTYADAPHLFDELIAAKNTEAWKKFQEGK